MIHNANSKTALNDLHQIQNFWEKNPLFAFESPAPVGTKEFFEWHNRIRCGDVEPFSIHLYEFKGHVSERVLDVGCGIGWLCWQFAKGGANLTGIDITSRGVDLTRQRLALDNLPSHLVQSSAEHLPFRAESFHFVTAAGVLHHTPDTLRAVQEVHRVLRPNGRAMISLYYKNWLLSKRAWPLTRSLVRGVFGHVPGREAFRQVQTVDDFVRIYDGNENPLGYSYSHQEVLALINNYFKIERLEVHYFPRRFLSFGEILPGWAHRLFDNYCVLMIYLSLQKTV